MSILRAVAGGPLRVFRPQPEKPLMITGTSATAGVGEEALPPGPHAAGAGKTGPPAEFVYDNGQILLELLRGRAEEEDRRRFVASLRRLRGAAPA